MKVPATFNFENSLWLSGKDYIVGIDEVGRGAWAGPLVSAAVIFPKNYSRRIKYFDSKLIAAKERERLVKIIEKDCLSLGIGETSVEEINNFGLTTATQLSYERAIASLTYLPEHYLIDAFYIKSLPKEQQTPIIHGDLLCSSIAAASIVAKVYRDSLMRSLAKTYRGYKFARNKGYGTRDHQEAISKFGFTDIHRVNYDLQFLKQALVNG